MPSETNVARRRDGKNWARWLGGRIAALAERQHGVVARFQLRALGATDDQIDGWIAAKRLLPVHRGVYLVGHRLRTVEAGWMAGVLIGGPAAVLSHRAAADHRELTGLARPLAEVTLPRYLPSRQRIRFHASSIPEDERTVHEGIPITTVSRTLLDLAAVESPARLRKAVAVAEARLLGDAPSLTTLIARYPGRRGLVSLRAAIEALTSERGIAHQELELRFDEFVDARDLPRPEKNARVEAAGRVFVVDCLWRDQGLVVELDSRAHHGDWEAAEADRARDLALLSVGLRVARVTWRRLHREADALEVELRAALETNVARP